MTIPDFESAPTRTKMVASVSVLNEETHDGQRRQIIDQAQGVDVVLDDSLVTVLLFIKRMPTVFFPIAIPIEVRNDEPVYESGQ
jgi:hypothetical protein